MLARSTDRVSVFSIPGPAAGVLVLLLILPIFLSSCGAVIFTRKVFGETLDMEVKVADVANDEYPLAMEVVYVYDEELLKTLLQMSAKQWFEKRNQLKNDFPDDSGFESWEWEFTPGQEEMLHLPLRGGIEGGIIFVNYFNEGQHRVRIQPFRDVKVRLDYSDFKVDPL
jgi:type VI secretion system protein